MRGRETGRETSWIYTENIQLCCLPLYQPSNLKYATDATHAVHTLSNHHQSEPRGTRARFGNVDLLTKVRWLAGQSGFAPLKVSRTSSEPDAVVR